MSFLINPFFVSPAGENPGNFSPFRWYSAESYSLADGATITTLDPWVDMSSNLSNATTTLGFEPSFHTGIFNALPAVRLQNGNEHLAFDSGFFTLTDFTIIVVAKVAGDSIWLSRNTFNRQIRVYPSSINIMQYFPGSGATCSSNPLAVVQTDARMLVWRRNAGTGLGDFYENDTLVAGTGNNTTGMEIGQIGIIDTAPLNIDIGEMVIYDSLLTDGNIVDLYDDYFKPKFGLP